MYKISTGYSKVSLSKEAAVTYTFAFLQHFARFSKYIPEFCLS